MAESARNIPSSSHFWMRFYAQLNIPSSASLLHVLGAVPSFISPHLNTFLPALRRSVLHLIRTQSASSFNQTTALTISVLANFLQLKYCNDQSKSPFDTHPRAMRVAVSSFVVHYLACTALLRFPLHRFAVAAHHCLVLSGYASIASLASVLLPDSFSPFAYAVFGLPSACELLYWLYQKLAADGDDAVFPGYRRRIRGFLDNMFGVVGNSSRRLARIYSRHE